MNLDGLSIKLLKLLVAIASFAATEGLAQSRDSLQLLRGVFKANLTENPERAVAAAHQMAAVAEKLDDDAANGEALFNIGQGHYFMGQIAKAMSFYKQARYQLQNAGSPELLSQVFNATGNCYVEIEDFASGLVNYKHALASSDSVSQKVKIYNNMGSVYIYLKRYDSAEQYFQKVLMLSGGDPEQKMVYMHNMAYIRYETNQYPEAIRLYRQSVSYAEGLREEKYLPRFYKNLADCYLRNLSYDSSLLYLDKCIALSKKTKRHAQEADALLSFSAYYDSMHLLNRAIEKAEEAHVITTGMAGYNRGKVYAQLSRLYYKNNNIDGALIYEKKHARYLDSVRLLHQETAIAAEAESDRTFDLEKTSTTWPAFLLGALALAVVMFLFVRRKATVNEPEKVVEVLPEGRYIKGQHKNGETLLPLNDIIWFEKIDRSYFACLPNEKYRIKPTITELEVILPATFVRINRSVIINLQYLLNYSPWENNKYVIRMRLPVGTEFVSSRDRIRNIEAQKGI
jgi:tetratricopeptide (TPR) repeat protein